MHVQESCSYCTKTFTRDVGRTREAIKMGWKPYCSRTCLYKAQFSGKTVRCGNPDCTATFYRPRKHIRNSTSLYCSRSCAARINNVVHRKRLKDLHVCARAGCGKNISTRLTYCSRACFRTEHTEYSPETLVKKIYVLSRKLQRTPAKREMGRLADMCVRAFGSWNNAVQIAGLKPHRSESDRMFKRIRTKARDGHVCDSISEALIDNWLTQNRIPHIRDAAYPSTRHKADWGISTKTFVEYFGLAKDSPRYDRSIKEKRKLCQKHRITLIELYPADLYPTSQLDYKLKSLMK